MTGPFLMIVDRVAQERSIAASDITALRGMVWGKPELIDADMRMLAEINRHIKIPSPEFTDFFAEAIVHFTLRQTDPKYMLKDHLADWLEERLIHDGRLGSYTELETLVRILEQAENAPDRFKRWTLAEIERSILTGQGPTRLGGNISPGVVDTDDAKYLRRALFARSGFGALAVTVEEAEMLFRIKDTTKDSLNAPEWDALFVQAAANFIQAHVGKAMLTEADKSRLERVMDDNRPHIGRFLGRMGDMSKLAQTLGFARNERDLEDEIAAANQITASEAGWLRVQIAADGRTDRYEKALLTFLADEAGGLPQALEHLRQAA